MTTEQIASRLAELCRQGQFEAAQKELYAENAVSRRSAARLARSQSMWTI